jgi:hypothetical protein
MLLKQVPTLSKLSLKNMVETSRKIKFLFLLFGFLSVFVVFDTAEGSTASAAESTSICGSWLCDSSSLLSVPGLFDGDTFF